MKLIVIAETDMIIVILLESVEKSNSKVLSQISIHDILLFMTIAL